MFNKVIIMGRICHGLELKNTTNGKSVLSFRVAVDRSYKDKNGERVADFHTVVAWGTTAEFVSKWFDKGRLILVEGELQTRSYEHKDGYTVYLTEIIADSVGFTGEKAVTNSAQEETVMPY